MQYVKNPPLLEAACPADPLTLFQAWLQDATAAGQIEPTAMALGTVGPEGQPSVRIVLFKGLLDGGLTFYTRYDGRKGVELAAQPRVAATFWWDRLERQVRFEGTAAPVPTAVSQAYFETRPRGSQLGAVTSRQSQVVATREELDARLAQTIARYEGQAVPRPDEWGGFRLEAARIEFWQGRRDRLHDRLCYQRAAPHEPWQIVRLEP